MQELLQAIFTKISTNSALLAAFPGYTNASGDTFVVNYFRDLAPEGDNHYPYLASNVIAAPSQIKFGGEAFSEVTIRYTALAKGDDLAALSLMKTFTGVFDELLLTLSSGANFNSIRRGRPVPRIWSEPEGDATVIWAASCTYDHIISP